MKTIDFRFFLFLYVGLLGYVVIAYQFIHKFQPETYGIQISSSLKISNKNILKNILEI